MTSSPPVTNSPQVERGECPIPRERLPRHIAVIMDGNGRWARQRGEPRIHGHHRGAEAARKVITECGKLGVEVLTLYSFSVENWKRPRQEIDALMELCSRYLVSERDELIRNGVQLRLVGAREGLPQNVLRELDETINATSSCGGLTLCLALNYGSRDEITVAVQTIARKIRSGETEPEAIDEAMISSHLYTAGLPDPDMLIRTAGEYRLSNYLLWQCSYAEIYVTDVLWPDFDERHLHDALRAYAGRSRRFGAIEDD